MISGSISVNKPPKEVQSYSTKDFHMVTQCSTSPAMLCLDMSELIGSLVSIISELKIIVLNAADFGL